MVIWHCLTHGELDGLMDGAAHLNQGCLVESYPKGESR
jgi:hypothetical protein